MTLASAVNLNSTTPAAPTGKQNIVFANDGGSPTVNQSAYDANMVGDTGSGGTAGNVPAPASGDAAAGKFLKADGTWAVPAGGASGALTQIAQSVVSGSSTSAVTFSAIPGTYSSLLLIAYGAVSDASSAVNISLIFNADTGSNYDFSEISGGFGSVGNDSSIAAANVGSVGRFPGSTAPANSVGTFELTVPSYASTVFNKQLMSRQVWLESTTAGQIDTSLVNGQWRPSTPAAIASITLTDTGGGHFIAGTVFTLYGLQ